MSHNPITQMKVSYIATACTYFDSSLGSMMLGFTFHTFFFFFDQVGGAKMPNTPYVWQVSWFV